MVILKTNPIKAIVAFMRGKTNITAPSVPMMSENKYGFFYKD